MGFMSYEQMMNEVSLNLSSDSPAPDRLKLWLNFAQHELVSIEGLEFEELKRTTTLAILEGDYVHSIPARALGIKTVSIVTADYERKLLKMDREFSRLEDQEGPPTHYMRRGEDIIIWPTPDNDYDAIIEYIEAPAEITSLSGVSPFPAIWDVALIHFATFHGLLALNKMEAAMARYTLAQNYVKTRLTPQSVEKNTLRAGLEVAHDIYDIETYNPSSGL